MPQTGGGESSKGKKRRLVYRLSPEPTGIAFSPLGCSPTGTGAPQGTVFQDKGTPKLTNVHVLLIFWGTQWAGNPNPLATQVTNAVRNLLAGPYMSFLAQYGVRRGSLWGTLFFTSSDPPQSFSYANVGSFIINQLDQDQLPEPDSDWPLFYCVIMPSNVSFQGDPRLETVPLPPGTLSKVVGANSSIIWNDYDLGDVDNDPAHYAWVGSDGTVDYITTVLSHELVEACTDPNGGNGIVQVNPPCAGGACQIGDPCTGICDFVRGVKVQSYWSQLGPWTGNGFSPNGACLVPKLYSVRRALAGAGVRLGGKGLSSIEPPPPTPRVGLNTLIAGLF